jgi:hypothetical protein
MARCDCAGGRCSCGVTAGDGIEVTGSGEATNPYVITAVGQPITGQLTVADTPSLNLTMTGQGEVNEPYVISGEVLSSAPGPITQQLSVQDTATLDLTLFGGGTVDEPYVISGDVLGAPGATVGSNLYGYGHSYMAGTRASDDDHRYFNIVARDGDFATFTNYAVSGSAPPEGAWRVLGTWNPATATGGIVLIDHVVNTVTKFWTNQEKGRAAFYNSYVTMCAAIRAANRHTEAFGDAFTYYGTWANLTIAGASTNSSSVAGDYFTYAWEGTEATVLLVGKDAAAGGTLFGTAAWSVDGGPEQLIDLTRQAYTYTPSDTAYGNPILYCPVPIRISGMDSGPHLLKVRNVAGGPVPVDGAYQAAKNPTGIVLIADAHRQRWATLQTDNPGVTADDGNAWEDELNNILYRVAREFGGPIVVTDTPPDWDYDTDMDVDFSDTNAAGGHPNDSGMAKYAAQALKAIRSLGASPAWGDLQVPVLTATSLRHGLYNVPQPVISDDFQRADSATTPGGPWSVIFGRGNTVATAWGIQSGNLYLASQPNTGTKWSYCTVRADTPNWHLRTTLAATTTGQHGILLSGAISNSHLMLALSPSGTTTTEYALTQLSTSGVTSTLALSGVVPTAGDVIDVYRTGATPDSVTGFSAGVVTVKVNGITVINHTMVPSTHWRSPRCGFVSNAITTARWADFLLDGATP